MLQTKCADDKFVMLATDFGHHDPKGVTKISILSPILSSILSQILNGPALSHYVTNITAGYNFGSGLWSDILTSRVTEVWA